MRKKLLTMLLITGVMCSILQGCSDTNGIKQTVDSPTPTSISTVPSPSPLPTNLTTGESEYVPSEENVKLLGRTYLLGETLWLTYSASGIEFTVTGTKAEITLIGDNMSSPALGLNHFCRVGIYVNDELVSDELLKKPKETITAFESTTEQTVTIKVLKLSEVTDSTVGIGKIKVTAKDPIKPTEAKLHRIEFIGDSITCGFGVDDSNVNGTYSTSTEDASKTYAYKTAQALNSDYSFVSISGYGIISGYTSNGTLKDKQIIPIYYDKMGTSYGYINNGIRVDSVQWDFKRYQPDLVVINLGTNDNSYTGTNSDRQEEFKTGYVSFLKQVRENNPDANILCTLGIMGDNLYPSIEEAVKRYTDETGDTKVSSMKFDVQLQSDGYGACWHPSEITHTKAAEKLTKQIQELMQW